MAGFSSSAAPAAGHAGAPSGHGLSAKWGPLPGYVWLGGGLLLLLVAANYRANKAKSSTSSTGDTSTDTTPADQVPETIFQNYTTTNVSTPSEPGPPGPAGPAGPPGASTPPTPPPKTTTPPPKPSPPKPVTKPKPTTKKPIAYVVKHGDTLSAIAAKYHTTWQKLFAFNTSSASGRPASTIAELKKRGPNLLYAGETILIPQS